MNVKSQASRKMTPPAYFSKIKQGASRRWDQLEADRELAGPWHQLFKQVQSPRHILSELLQNADDAGASEAKVSIRDDRFVFEHNGEDFSEANFGSICRFGYSNKRALHTIGFRGIGFKSTFSLGNRVELYSPTLAVAFERDRFTEPHWIEGRSPTAATTRVEVAIGSPQLRLEVEKNLDEWLRSSTSILFFKNIRRLRIGDNTVHWQSQGTGPVPDSEWMTLAGQADERFLLLRSSEAPFPPEALDEIRKERMLDTDDETAFPPCRVEILLGAQGKLYVVLPTGVETSLPFACNAPFIQDPARLKIKDPAISPTNRWLLARAGELAAGAMTRWLEQSDVQLQERAHAYRLLPDVERAANSIESACATLVAQAFTSAIHGEAVVLTEGAQLVPAKAAVQVPSQMFEIWSVDQLAALISEKSTAVLCRHVAAEDRKKLVNWNLVETFAKSDLLARLREQHPPRPSSWPQLLNLWSYIASETTSYRMYDADQLRINPVQGKDELYAAAEVVRLGEKKLLQSELDWEFLAERLNVLHQDWLCFLAKQQPAKSDALAARNDPAVAALAVLKKIGLGDTSDAGAVVERVAKSFFRGKQLKLQHCVQLAQIAAKLNATIGGSFRYACHDLTLRSVETVVLYDQDGQLEPLLPNQIVQAQVLHPDYTERFTSCSRDEWRSWVSSGRSGLKTSLPLIQKNTNIHSRETLATVAQARGLRSELQFAYVRNTFCLEDWDFPDSYWQHWDALSQADARIWTKVVARLAEHDGGWQRCASAGLSQLSTSGTTKPMTSAPLLPGWVLKLRAKPCLPDARGEPHLPDELFRRTAATESLLEVEPFVHASLDRESARPLLDLLGVRSVPSGPDRLLNRLRVLAKSDRSPPHEVEKWYRRLDQMLDACSSADAATIKQAMSTERIILSHDGTWVTSQAVFLTADEDDAPGAALIRPSVADLSLWRRVGVAERPSAELALRWLGSLPSGAALSSDDGRRVRMLQARYAARVWDELGHWTNLLGEWTPRQSLVYGLSMQGLIRRSHLHDWVKRQTADFQRLPAETVQGPTFSFISPLSELIVEKLVHSPILPELEEECAWLTTFGDQVARIELSDPDETARMRRVGEALSHATWVTMPRLEVLPYLNDIPAGTATLADVLWTNGKLYASPLSKAKLAKSVPDEIGKSLNTDLRAALTYAFGRPPEDIRAYFRENFSLGPETSAIETPIEATESQGRDATPEDRVAEADDARTSDDGQEGNVVWRPGEEPVDPEADEGEGAAAPQTDEPPTGAGEEVVDHQQSGKPRASSKPGRLPIMARFAALHGYRPDDNGRLVAADGGWIGRVSGAIFPWERRTSTGDLDRQFYPKEHCLSEAPLQIEAEVWSLLDQKPDVYSLIVTDAEGGPLEISGARLRGLREKGRLSIHPASYRLVVTTADVEN